jgi:hypothetical protein
MKKVLLVMVLVLMGVKGWGQSGWWYNDSLYNGKLLIDTNSSCKWQIGKANKTVFQTINKVIVTDSINPVPAKDTSVFVIKFPRISQVISYLTVTFALDGDSSDYGKIEVSPDSGHHWVDILKEDSVYHIIWRNGFFGGLVPKPSFKGASNGTKIFWADMTTWAHASFGYPVLWPLITGAFPPDSILYRFTYITDSGSAPHDGWMIDHIETFDYYNDGITDPSNCVQLSLSPNPVSDVLHITKLTAKHEEIEVVNMMGEVVIREHNFTGETVDVRGLAKGVYLLRYSSDKGVRMERFEHL